MPLGTNSRAVRFKRERGVSMIELAIVLLVVMVISAMAIPQLLNAINMYKLRNACSSFAGIAQQARSRAVQDSAYYSVYFNTSDSSMTEAFVGVKGSTLDTKNDPIVQWGPEIRPQTYASAPDWGALKTIFLASAGSSATTLYDAAT
jgi:type II secretory pathway pseudopilin PulG